MVDGLIPNSSFCNLTKSTYSNSLVLFRISYVSRLCKIGGGAPLQISLMHLLVEGLQVNSDTMLICSLLIG